MEVFAGMAVLVGSTLLAVCMVLLHQDTKTRNGERDRHLQTEKEKNLKHFESVVKEHVSTLSRRRIILIRRDRYGVVDFSAWRKELSHFIINVVMQKVDIFSLGYSPDGEIDDAIELIIDEYDLKRDVTDDLAEGITPSEFEGHCCEIMREEGWDAHVTKGSGDQGADVVDTKDNQRLVVQCKLYSGTVGNKAVQEVLAAKSFYGADHAAVVCTTGYTKAAQQLAQSSDVALLMYHELRDHVATL